MSIKTKTNRSKKAKNAKKETPLQFRHFAEIFVPLLLLGFVFVNSLYLDGYYCSESVYEYGNLIAGSSGYTAQDNYFQYTGEESSYVQIYGEENVDQLTFTFGQKADQDRSATLYYLDEEGNVTQTSSQGVWKKNSYTLKIDLEDGAYNSYLLSIPADFTLAKAYYAWDKGYEGTGKLAWFFAMAMLVLILSAVLVCLDSVRRNLCKVEERAAAFYQQLRQSFSPKKAGIFGGIVAGGLLLSFVLAQAGLYRYSGKLAMAVFFFSLLIAIVVVNYKEAGKKIELISFFVILLSGSAFSFIEPANVGVSWDDEVHYQNAVRYSHFFDKDISVADMTVINEYATIALQKVNYSREEQVRYNSILDDLERSGYYEEMEKYPVSNVSIAYLPSALGLAVGRGLGLPFHIVFFLGRWMNVLLLAVLSYFAMKRLRSGKIVVLLIAMIPTNIFMAGNYTYDIWLFAWSIFGLSVFFGEWQRPDEKIGKWTPWLIGVSMFLAVLPKQVYFPLTCITLFMPRSKFHTAKQAWLYRIVILAAVCLPFMNVLVNNLSTQGEGVSDARSSADVNSVEQLKYVRENPAQVMNVFYIYLRSYLNPFVYGREYLTNMAYLGYLSISEKIYLFLILIGALISQEEKVSFPWWSRLGVIFVYIVTGAVAAFSMYVYFTGVGSNTVAGCQGRYLLPAIFPLVYVVTRFPIPSRAKKILREEIINLILIVLLSSAVFWGIWQGCLSLY